MSSYNKTVIVGHLTRDPELRYTPNGTAIAAIGIAVNRTWTGEDGQKHEEVSFLNCTAFGRTAENIGQLMRKGSQMLVDGYLKQYVWEDKQTRQQRSAIKIIVERAVFLGGARGNQQPEGERQQQSKEWPNRRQQSSQDAGQFEDGPPESDDVPF